MTPSDDLFDPTALRPVRNRARRRREDKHLARAKSSPLETRARAKELSQRLRQWRHAKADAVVPSPPRALSPVTPVLSHVHACATAPSRDDWVHVESPRPTSTIRSVLARVRAMLWTWTRGQRSVPMASD